VVNRHRALTMAMVGACALLLQGCTGAFSGSGGGDVSVVSTTQNTRLDFNFRTTAYSYLDENTADLYFTDLSVDQIEAILAGQPRNQIAPEGAQLLHVHLFLVPRAGRTPIDFAASNITMTHIVLSGEGIGVYGGGGFLLPSRLFALEPGGSRFGGTMRDATLRFVTGSRGFTDRIDSGVIGGSLSARLDPPLARQINALIDELIRAAAH